jgi:hypothetical protein
MARAVPLQQLSPFSLAAVNDAPALTGTQATLVAGTEDTPYTLTEADLLAGFTDVDGDSLSVSDLTASNGTIRANEDGTYTFTPAANFNGSCCTELQRSRWQGRYRCSDPVLLAHRRQRCSRPRPERPQLW